MYFIFPNAPKCIVLLVLLCSNNQTQIPKEPKAEEFVINIQSPRSLGLAYIGKNLSGSCKIHV